jgi:hypothetical protein
MPGYCSRYSDRLCFDSHDFSSAKRLDRIWRPPILLFIRYRPFFVVVKWPGREANHLRSTSVTNGWTRTLLLLLLLLTANGFIPGGSVL